jgi:hypothetical protein
MKRGALFSCLLAAGCGPFPPRVPPVYDSVTRQGPFQMYSAGSLLAEGDTPESGARRVGCADVRVEALTASVPKTSIGLAFKFGNRCHRPIPVALPYARVVATWADGTSETLTLFDPEGKVHAPVLDARTQGTELLQFDTPRSAPSGPAQSICVDVSHITSAESSESAAPICLVRRGTFANLDTIVGHGPHNEESWQRLGWRGLFEVGFAANYIDLHGVTWSGSTPAGQSFRFDASPLGGAATYELDLRILTWFGGPFYAGGMLQFGAGPTAQNIPFVVADTPVRTYASLGDFAFGAVAGVATRGSEKLRFRFDVTGGARFIISDLTPAGCGDSTCPWDLGVWRPLVEPRLVLDAWVSPWFSVAAWLQADALYLPDFGVGLSAAFHLWAYDGAR